MEAELRSYLESEPLWDDFFVVSVEAKGDSLAVEVDRDSGLSVEDCAEVHARVNAWLEARGEDLEVEVGSPGLTRPLRTPRQYAKHRGAQVEVLRSEGPKLHGELVDSDAQGFTVRVRGKVRREGSKRPEWESREFRFEYQGVKRVQIQIGGRGKARDE